LPPAAQEAIRKDLNGNNQHPTHELGDQSTVASHRIDDETPTATIPITSGS
jgi:hypothetical protein